jgi:hypothetical protein
MPKPDYTQGQMTPMIQISVIDILPEQPKRIGTKHVVTKGKKGGFSARSGIA